MADYSRPKPIDPLWFRMDAKLRIRCKCQRRLIIPLAQLARLHQLPDDLALYQLIGRLRCTECGQRPLFADVSRSNTWGKP